MKGLQYIMLACLCAYRRKLNIIIFMLTVLTVAAGYVLVRILIK